ENNSEVNMFFFSRRRRHTRSKRDWSSDVCSSDLIKWDGGKKTLTPEGNIRSKGISCFWKTSSTPSNATAGAIIKFNKDGSVNLNCAAVELGQGPKTVLAQILAEKLKMDMTKISISL